MATVSQISRFNASHIEHDTQKQNAKGSCREDKHESGAVKHIIASSSVQNRKDQCTIKVKPNDLLSACIIVYIYSSMCRFEAPPRLRNYVNVPCRLSEYHSRLRGVLRLFSEWKLVVPLLPGLCQVTGTCSVAPAPSERPITLLAQARRQETSAKSLQMARLKAQWYI